MTDVEKGKLEEIFPKHSECECGGNFVRDEQSFMDLCECISDNRLNWALVAYSPRITYICDTCGKKLDRTRHGLGEVRK